MEKRTFGNTDLACSAIGIGTWALGTTQYGPVDIEEAKRAINVALDRGVTLVDTAEVYGPFHSEEIVADALGPRRKDVVLVSKVGFDYNHRDTISGRKSTYEHVMVRTEGCLRRLETDWIDLLLVHWPDHDTPYDEPIRAMEALKKAGKIRYYGVSNFSPAMMDAAARGGALTTNQIGYNLIDRRVESTVLPYCRAHGIGFMAYGTLCYGLLTGGITPETSFVDWDWRSKGRAFGLPLFEQDQLVKEVSAVARLQTLAKRFNKSVAQLAIAWVLSHADVTVTLVGMRTPAEAEENLADPDWRLSDEVIAEIDTILAEEGVPTYQGTRIAL